MNVSVAVPTPIVNNVRRIAGVCIDLQGKASYAIFTLEYFDGSTRITFDGKSCVVNRPYSSKQSTLVCVNVGSDKVKPLFPLYSGVEGGHYAGRDGNNFFVKVPDGEALTVFYPDGVVATFKAFERSSKTFKYSLSPKEAFDARLTFISKMLTKAATLEGDAKVLKQDRSLHEMAAMLGMSKNYPELRKRLVDDVIALGIPLRRNVFDHFSRACSTARDGKAWMQIRAYSDPMQIGIGAVAPGQSKGKPASEKSRKAERANRDRELRNSMKSNSGGGQKKSGKGKN